jgi:hypothetical protein
MGQSLSYLSIGLPRGEYADLEEMRSYGETLQCFVHQQEALLPAMTDVQRHNDIIDYLQSLADGYNEQLRVYKAAELQRQQLLLVTLIRLVG